jgi:phosphoribosylformylglycinamidine synthase subunit PurSL
MVARRWAVLCSMVWPVAANHTLAVIGEETAQRSRSLTKAATHLANTVTDGGALEISCARLVFVTNADDASRASELLLVPLVTQADERRGEGSFIESALHVGVTDSLATELRRAAMLTGHAMGPVATGWRYEVRRVDGAVVNSDVLQRLGEQLLVNNVIERWSIGSIDNHTSAVVGGEHGGDGDTPRIAIDVVSIRQLDAKGLAALDRQRQLTFDAAEFAAVQTWFRSQHRDPTDAELEMLAQTWSEHCAHITFRAALHGIDAAGNEFTIEPLISQLRRSTDRIAAPFVRSAFVGNAGIAELAPGVVVAVKAETHNHPSAIEPFGGANTGVGGVLRDVMAAPARPIAATDVLCFGPLDLDPALVPAGALHPRRVADGVIDGVGDYGNKLGVPTVAGAVLHDPGYTANPLVFCGCVGLVPEHQPLTGPHSGDRVVVLGGATGRDGIKGATFSSAEMDATTGDVAGASVQIGDPIVEKLVADALDELIDLYSAITDCGAGGLSSAVGELAEHIGVDVELDHVRRKYAGLAPWEVWLSEAQERMVIAVAPEQVPTVRAVCARHGVDVDDIGAFRNDGQIRVTDGGRSVIDMPAAFIHGGRPQRSLRVQLPQPVRSTNGVGHAASTPTTCDASLVLLALLSHPTIASKEAIVRRFDHEVRGATMTRPLTGVHMDAPSDGVVIVAPPAAHGIAIGLGVNPWWGALDPYRMAWGVVDEAIRNVVVAGGDPSRLVLLDNFSWGDPNDPATLGALAEAVRGCCDAADAFGAPFISGKDSLNNCYLDGDGVRTSIPPTLVIHAIAGVPDPACCPTVEPAPSDVLVMVGRHRGGGGNVTVAWGGSHFMMTNDRASDVTHREVPAPDDDAPERYRRIHALMRDGLISAAHDVSEGGVAVALCEMALAADASMAVTLAANDSMWALFGEDPGRIVLAVAARHLDDVLARLGGEAVVIGAVGERSHDVDDARFVDVDDARFVNVDDARFVITARSVVAGQSIGGSDEGGSSTEPAQLLIDVSLRDARAAFHGGPW